MKKTATILAALGLSVASSIAGPMPPAPAGPPPPMSDPCAGPISYNSLELLYANTNGDFNADDADGVRLNFEYSPASNFYVRITGGYDSGNIFDEWNLSAGIGGYIALTENIHAAIDGGLIYSDFSKDDTDPRPLFSNAFDDNDTGWYVRPHLRAKFGCFEIQAGATYKDIYNDTNWDWFAQVYYQVAQGWDISAGWNEGVAEADVWTVGVRKRF